jgi:hypothetical protein
MGSSSVYNKPGGKDQVGSGPGGVGNSSLLQLLRSGPAFTPQQQLESHRASMSLAGFASGLSNALQQVIRRIYNETSTYHTIQYHTLIFYNFCVVWQYLLQCSMQTRWIGKCWLPFFSLPSGVRWQMLWAFQWSELTIYGQPKHLLVTLVAWHSAINHHSG